VERKLGPLFKEGINEREEGHEAGEAGRNKNSGAKRKNQQVGTGKMVNQ